MKPVLVAYATKHGSTEQVAVAVAARLRAGQLDVEVRHAQTVHELGAYRGVVLGAPIYMGKWHRDAVAFLRRHRNELTQVPVAVFALGPRSLEPADVAESKSQLLTALAKVPAVRPYPLAVFGGVIDPAKLSFPFSRMPASDARDWDAVDAFGDQCARAYDYGKAAVDSRDLRNELQHAPR
jgi:menaquinone-dependent protoporphyrinogen oxidase